MQPGIPVRIKIENRELDEKVLYIVEFEDSDFEVCFEHQHFLFSTHSHMVSVP